MKGGVNQFLVTQFCVGDGEACGKCRDGCKKKPSKELGFEGFSDGAAKIQASLL